MIGNASCARKGDAGIKKREQVREQVTSERQVEGASRKRTFNPSRGDQWRLVLKPAPTNGLERTAGSPRFRTAPDTVPRYPVRQSTLYAPNVLAIGLKKRKASYVQSWIALPKQHPIHLIRTNIR